MKTSEKINVKRDEKNPEPLEIIAKHILQLSEAMEKFNKNSLVKDRVLILLLHDLTGIPMGQIQKVLKAIPQLKKDYIK